MNIFKKKEEEKKADKKPEVLKKAIKDEVKMPKIKKKNAVIGLEILHSPHITEKATDATELNKYVFKVWEKTNKIAVKESIESIYGVDVLDVNIVNIHRKKRRVGKNIGWAKGYKKAIVTVKKGQKIEIMSR